MDSSRVRPGFQRQTDRDGDVQRRRWRWTETEMDRDGDGRRRRRTETEMDRDGNGQVSLALEEVTLNHQDLIRRRTKVVAALGPAVLTPTTGNRRPWMWRACLLCP